MSSTSAGILRANRRASSEVAAMPLLSSWPIERGRCVAGLLLHRRGEVMRLSAPVAHQHRGLGGPFDVVLDPETGPVFAIIARWCFRLQWGVHRQASRLSVGLGDK